MAKTFVLGDPHGRNEAVADVLRKARFNYSLDTLIILGDVVDGGRHTRQLIDIFLKVKNRIFVYGNHDIWAQGWYNHGNEDPHDDYNWNLPVWIHQGGQATIESYDGDWYSIPKSHIEFMNSGVYYYIDENNNLFVHGGLNPDKPIEQQKFYDLMWDRNIIEFARYQPIPGYNLVFIGHTTVAHAMCDAGIKEKIPRNSLVPLRLNNLIMMDTGAGWDGQISLMNVETLEYWQSQKGINRPHDWSWC